MKKDYFDLGLDFQKDYGTSQVEKPEELNGGFSKASEEQLTNISNGIFKDDVDEIIQEDIKQGIQAQEKEKVMDQQEFFDKVQNAIDSGDFEGKTEEEIFNGFLESATIDGYTINGLEENQEEYRQGLEQTEVEENIEKEEEIEEDREGFDLGLDIAEGIQSAGKMLKVESKFDTNYRAESLGGAFVKSGKQLLNALRFGVNLPGDTIEFAGDLTGMASNVVGTARSVKDISVGLADKMGLAEGTEEQKIMVDSIGKAFKENFGTFDKAMDTIQKNPFDTITTVFGGVGLAKGGLKATKFGKTTEGVEFIKKLEKIEQATNPLNIVKAEIIAGKKAANSVKTLKNKISPKESLDDLVFKASQATNKADIPKFAKALSKLDTKKVKTYEDLNGLITDKIKSIVSKQNELLPDEAIYKIEDLTQTSKGGTIKVNYVEKALEDMSKFYKKTSQIDDLEKIIELQAKDKLSIKDINNIAREYNINFGQKAFNKMGEAKFSDIGQGFENIRKGVKETARSLLPDDTMKMLDSELSNLYTSKNLTEKMVKSVDNLSKKLKTRGIGYTIINGTLKLADRFSFGGLKGIRDYFITKNVGNQVNNSIDLQNNLPKVLKQIDKLNKIDSKISNKSFISKIKKILEELLKETTKNINGEKVAGAEIINIIDSNK